MRTYLLYLLVAISFIGGLVGLVMHEEPLGVGLLLFGIIAALLARIIQAQMLAEAKVVAHDDERDRSQR